MTQTTQKPAPKPAPKPAAPPLKPAPKPPAPKPFNTTDYVKGWKRSKPPE